MAGSVTTYDNEQARIHVIGDIQSAFTDFVKTFDPVTIADEVKIIDAWWYAWDSDENAPLTRLAFAISRHLALRQNRIDADLARAGNDAQVQGRAIAIARARDAADAFAATIAGTRL